MSFTNKVVLITGGGSGIGAATAILFTREDAQVAIVGRTEEKLTKVAEECEKYGKRPLVIKADVSIDEELNTIIDKTVTQYGKLDILVNNAGITVLTKLLDADLVQNFDKIVKVNLRAIVSLSNKAAPHIINTKGSIINVSSILSTKVRGDQIIYGSLKAALDYFTRASALDLAPYGVRVNAVNPGYTKTNLLNFFGQEDIWERLIPRIPLGKCAEASEVGNMILYLASDKAKSVTGSTYVIDNGSMHK
ncbi:3-oxoacyl-[acyl-carrier-protein] reductase FabG [Bombyx mori]|uniref:Uncharacterized protein n=1 Tax=Bombyx mori TaxID=7091 RepID=A0A8R2AIR4_BOMMO|nr:3-oxoacyl-[acyl-carrier-protein] reductase FabG [Bombyx mori]